MVHVQGNKKSPVINDLQSSLDTTYSSAKIEEMAGGYEPPAGGIPKEDLSDEVQGLLAKAESAIQQAALNTALAGKLDATAQAADSAKLGGKAASEYQPAISATGAANLLTAPTAAGEQPGTKPVADFATPADVDAAQFAVDTPDYANIESTNRITVNGNTWTADRDGFVLCSVTPALVPNGVTFEINSKTIFRAEVTQSGYAPTALLKVKQGQIVRISCASGGANAVSCYFVPPVKIQAPTVNLNEWETLTFTPESGYTNTGFVAKLNRATREICLRFNGMQLPANRIIGSAIGTLTIPSGYAPVGSCYNVISVDIGTSPQTGSIPVTVALGASGLIVVDEIIQNMFNVANGLPVTRLYGQIIFKLDV